MEVMKIFLIFIKYLKDLLLEKLNKGCYGNLIFESDIDFVFVVLVFYGEGVKMLM